MSDDELPELASLLYLPRPRQNAKMSIPLPAPRRSPRKHKTASATAQSNVLEDAPELFLSSQQRASPQKLVPPNRGMLRSTQGKAITKPASDRPKSMMLQDLSGEENECFLKRPASPSVQKGLRIPLDQQLPTSRITRITQSAKQKSMPNTTVKSTRNPYILKEAHCEDLNESSGTDDEDEDTNLSGFIVDDDVGLSFYDSENDADSDNEKWRRPQRKQENAANTESRRRLVRGRRNSPSHIEQNHDHRLVDVLDNLSLGAGVLESQKDRQRRETIEVIDLTESPIQEIQRPPTTTNAQNENSNAAKDTLHNPFADLTALRLQPPSASQPSFLLPSKSGPRIFEPGRSQQATERPSTPPRTPPRSPSKTKLKSPSKLLSPSKWAAQAPPSPHRQSLDAFWDHNVINDWHDTYSPKKAPVLSPRKNPLSRFMLDLQDDVFEDDAEVDAALPTAVLADPFDESTDSLPSPGESPSKSKSPSKISAMKAEQLRIRQDKKTRLLAKKKFDAEKEYLARNLLLALDEYVTDSKISEMSASTGGIKIVWSKTLRSTAGRANWKRTITKPSGSPVKGDPNSQYVDLQAGIVVKHFASIELAEKIIDRPERLVDTISHEFCHLANFMVSGVRDQPHGQSFKRWGRKVTSWMTSSVAQQAVGWREEWTSVEVTTKHSYIVETKYLWACTGRPADRQKQSLAMKMLNIEPEDEEGCGAEYGRHSKSIDTQKQRCGRCKGFLVQVRPMPRALASPRKSPKKRNVARSSSQDDSNVESVERLLEIIDLSD